MSDVKAGAPKPAADFGRLYRRLTRRETHSPRSGLAITLALIGFVVVVYLGAEFMLRVLGQRALLAEPAAVADAVVQSPTYPVAALIGGGALVALIGVIFLIVAFTGGRRPRHTLISERVATVVDNEVIASALARHAAKAAHTSPDNTSVAVSHRTAVVSVTPTSGIAVDKAAVTKAVDDQLASYGLKPGIRSRIDISTNGRVGA